MKFPRAISQRQLLLYLLYFWFTSIALVNLENVLEYDLIPWGWVVASAVVTAILAGPIPWIARDRLSRERRVHLGYVVGGTLLCGLVLLGLGLISGNLPFFMDAVALGGIIGLAVALLVEKAAIPERLQGITQ